MTSIKLDSKIGGGPASALEPLVPGIYARPGCRILGVVELHHVERTQPAPDSESEPAVKVRMSSLEIAGKDHEPALRDALRALQLVRTATGTLDEYGQLQLSKGTIERTAGLVADVEMARMIAGVRALGERARRAATKTGASDLEMKRELKAIADALTDLLMPSLDGPEAAR